MSTGRRAARAALALIVLLAATAPAAAHPAPFSFVDVLLDGARLVGWLTVHDLDAAHELGMGDAGPLIDSDGAAHDVLLHVGLLSPRLHLNNDGEVSGLHANWPDSPYGPESCAHSTAQFLCAAAPGAWPTLFSSLRSNRSPLTFSSTFTIYREFYETAVPSIHSGLSITFVGGYLKLSCGTSLE